MDDAALDVLRVAASATFDVGFATMIGALATLSLLHDTTSDWAARGALRCRALFMRASVLALAADLAWMALQTCSMTGLPPVDALQAIGGVAADTSFGRAWAVRAVVLAACIGLAFAKRYRPMPIRWLGAGVVLVGVERANAGHAGANGVDWRIPATAVHMLATGLWAGSVFGAARAMLRGAVHADDGVRYARRLSRLCTAALMGVTATGVALAWRALGATLAPLGPAGATTWGLVLDAKLALVAAAVALGGVNRFLVMPTLPHGWRRFAWVMRLESAVLVAALVAAALLANGEPPAV